MELDENQTQACKFSRVGINGRNDSSTNKITQKLASENNLYPDEGGGGGGANGGGEGGGDGGDGIRGWHHSSRIIRVSRASGGKDRHSKVWTSKGLRDRRVRLSVTTAIQFYDLQDRLGCDQPSKAVEWLIKAAADAISELPSLNTSSFPDTPKQLSDDQKKIRGTAQMFDSAEVELDPNNNNYQQSQSQSQHFSLSKSACSSNSETSKNSGLSLSRSDVKVNRVKARERARERAAKEKEQNLNNPISQNSFTELLTGGINGGNGNNNDDNDNNNNNNHSSPAAHHQNPNIAESDFFNRARQWPVTQMDYFATAGLLGPSSAAAIAASRSHGFVPGQIQLGNSLLPQFHLSSNENQHQELQHFSFVPNPEHLIPVAAAAAATAAVQPGQGGAGVGGGGGDYNLNFTISSSGGLAAAGFNRGTLQSNSSPSSFMPPHHHFQKFSSIDGFSPFFIGAPTMENHHNHHHHQFPAAGLVDGRGLQLCYGDGSSRSSDQKGKGKN